MENVYSTLLLKNQVSNNLNKMPLLQNYVYTDKEITVSKYITID